MKTIKYSTQFKKDFKKYRNNKKKVEKLLEVFRMLTSIRYVSASERLILHTLYNRSESFGNSKRYCH